MLHAAAACPVYVSTALQQLCALCAGWGHGEQGGRQGSHDEEDTRRGQGEGVRCSDALQNSVRSPRATGGVRHHARTSTDISSPPAPRMPPSVFFFFLTSILQGCSSPTLARLISCEVWWHAHQGAATLWLLGQAAHLKHGRQLLS